MPTMVVSCVRIGRSVNFGMSGQRYLESVVKLSRNIQLVQLKSEVYSKVDDLDDFDKYVLQYFYEGVAKA